MSLLAGEVYAVLGGKFNAGGFNEFDRRMHASAATMEASEKRIGSSVQRSNRHLQSLGHAAKIGAGAGLLALAGTIGYSVKQAADFDAAMRNVNSIAGLSEGQFRKLSASVKSMAGETAQSPKVLAQGLYQLVSSGFKAGESVKILHAAAISASAGLTDTTTAVTALAGVLNAYHLPASQATAVSDVLFQTVNRGVITFEELAQTIGTVLPFATNLNIPLKDVGAAISTLTKNGIPAANATTYLKNAMVAFLKPSDGMKAAIKATGAASGEALVRQKGFQGALEAVAKQTDGTKAGLQKLFPEIRAASAAFSLTGKGAKSAEADVKAFGDTAGSSQKVFAEQSKSVELQLRKTKAQIEQAAITLGNQFLPILASGAQHLAAFVQHLDETGQLQSFGQGIIHGGKEAVTIIGDLANVAETAVSPLVAVAKALDLADASHLEAIGAAFVGFKAATAAAGGIKALTGALVAADAAAGAQNLKLLPFLLTRINPVTAAAVAVGGLAAALVLLGGSESEESRLAEQNAAAHKAQAEAIKSVSDAEHASADAGLALKQAHLDEKQAQATVNKLRHEGKTNTDAYKQAVIDLDRATLRAGDAQKQYTKNLGEQNSKNDALIKGAKDRLEIARKEFEQTSKPVPVGGRGIASSGALSPEAMAQRLRDQAHAQQNLVDQTQAYVQAVARANVSDANRQRLMNASRQITGQNVQGVSDLVNAIKDLPASKQAKILVQNQDALAKLGDLTTRLGGIASRKTITTVIAGADSAQSALVALTAIAKGVPARKVTQVLAQTGSAKAELAAIRALIASLPASKTTTINTVHNDIFNRTTGGSPSTGGARRTRAAGRGPDGSERALTGEGAAAEYIVDSLTGAVRKVTQPTIVDLKDTDYVIPIEDQYRGRALGLLADLMKDLGVAGYKKGRKRIVPKPPKDYHVADPDVLSSEIQKLEQLAGQKDKTGKHPTAKAKEAQRELPAVKAAYRQAHAAANRIDANSERAANAYKALQNADKRDDQPAFDKQLGLYNTALTNERKGLQTIWDALGKAHKRDTKYGRHIQDLLLGVQGDLFDAQSLTNQPEEGSDAQLLADTGLTKAETDALAQINKNIALAALTPTLEDDKTYAGQLVGLLKGALDRDVAAGAAPGVIQDLAGQLKTAQDNVDSLNGSGPGNDNPDLQARIDQITRQRDNALAEAKINAQALSVFSGAGSINGGVVQQITLQSLVPPDETWIRTIGDLATRGQDAQPSRLAPVEHIGL